MKKIVFLAILFCQSVLTFSQEFKVVGYYTPTKNPEEIQINLLTHINYAFAIPAKSGDTLLPIGNPENLIRTEKFVHKNGKQIFISVGGWGIGDGGGDDTRFHKMAERAEGRHTFVKNIMAFVKKYNMDGVDFDWEYPDEDSPSADHYVALVTEMADALHKENKKLTAAVISYGKKGYGTKIEVFEKMDWLNLMAYDDDYGPNYVVAHSPYSLAIKSLDYWLIERGLPAKKATLGLPFYSKKGMGNYGPSYKDLLKDGASPFDDYWKGAFYNGTMTIEAKTKLAKQRGLAGVMIWEISSDTSNEWSLLKAIERGAKY